jgi:hypothetical protein
MYEIQIVFKKVIVLYRGEIIGKMPNTPEYLAAALGLNARSTC